MGHFYQNLLRQEGSLECITAARYQYGNSDQEQEHSGSARASNESSHEDFTITEVGLEAPTCWWW